MTKRGEWRYLICTISKSSKMLNDHSTTLFITHVERVKSVRENKVWSLHATECIGSTRPLMFPLSFWPEAEIPPLPRE